jgi:hypothetical protein
MHHPTPEPFEDSVSVGLGQNSVEQEISAGPRWNNQLARQQTRVQEYRAEAARKADPLAATIAGNTADFFEIQSCLGAAILDELRDGPLTLQDLPHFQPALDLLYRAAKYSAQFTELGIKLFSIDALRD